MLQFFNQYGGHDDIDYANKQRHKPSQPTSQSDRKWKVSFYNLNMFGQKINIKMLIFSFLLKLDRYFNGRF